MNRRRLLASVPAALVLAGAGAGAAVQAAACNPDAALIAHCAAFDALERAYLATDFGHDDGTPEDEATEAERERLASAQEPIVDAICTLPPRTLAGFRAVASSLALWDTELMRQHPTRNCTDDRLLRALVGGLIGQAPAAVPAPNPDAELLALCAEFQRLHAEGADTANPDWEKADAAAWDAFNKIDDMTPTTEAGHRAKAGVAVKMLSMFHDGQQGGDPEAVFALYMLRDWLRLPA